MPNLSPVGLQRRGGGFDGHDFRDLADLQTRVDTRDVVLRHHNAGSGGRLESIRAHRDGVVAGIHGREAVVASCACGCFTDLGRVLISDRDLSANNGCVSGVRHQAVDPTLDQLCRSGRHNQCSQREHAGKQHPRAE